MQKYNGQLIRQFASSVSGNAASGVTVTVRRKSDNALATLYVDNNTAGATLSNPITTTDKGFFAFYAADGVYTLTFSDNTPQQVIQLQDVAALQDQFDSAVLNAGYIPSGTFAAGATLTQANQVLSDGSSYWRWDGSFPKTVTAGSVPVPTGVGGWIVLSDFALRGDLEAGTALINGVPASQLSVVSVVTPAASYSVVDLHYGALRGRGATNTETFSEGIYSVASPSAPGSTSITLTANSSVNYSVALVANQMIAYLGSDGKYHSAAVASVSGNTINLCSSLVSGVAAGNNVFSFYVNEAHPTTYGYYAIADYAIQAARVSYKKAATLEMKNPVGGATVTADTSELIGSVGSSSVAAFNVSCPTAASDGISGSVAVKESGGHLLRFVLNSGGVAGSIIVTIGAHTNTVTFNTNEPIAIDVPVAVSTTDGVISVFIKTNTNGGSFKLLRNVAVLKAEAVSPTLNGGKHVLLGDSWFQQGQFFDRLVERLPKAEVVNKGVGGQTAGQIVGRFEADVAPENPDVVWFISGTNDYYQNVAPELFNYYINQLKAKCAAIGAHLVMLTSSVGAAQFDTTRFNVSRRLANETLYHDSSLESATGRSVLISIPTTVVPNGSTVQLANLGIYSDSVTVLEYYIVGAGMKIGRKSSMAGLPTYLATFANNALTTADATYTFSGGQFIEITGENTSGVTQTYYGYVKVRES